MNIWIYKHIDRLSLFYEKKKEKNEEMFQYLKIMKSNFDRVHNIDDDSDLSSAKCKHTKTYNMPYIAQLYTFVTLIHLSCRVPRAASAFFLRNFLAIPNKPTNQPKTKTTASTFYIRCSLVFVLSFSIFNVFRSLALSLSHSHVFYVFCVYLWLPALSRSRVG